MPNIEVIIPALGEGIFEVTIIKWLKKENEDIEQDETLVEIATDKVDTEITAPVTGKIIKINCNENSIAKVGSIIAVIATKSDSREDYSPSEMQFSDIKIEVDQEKLKKHELEYINSSNESNFTYYSPLVKEIAKKENLNKSDLDKIIGTGINNRITKFDILEYIDNKLIKNIEIEQVDKEIDTFHYHNNPVNIIEMDRIRKIIAEHMSESVRISPHVTTFIETDASSIVYWREKYKKTFEKKYNQKLTYTPIIIDAVIKALKEYPRINSSLEIDKIIEKKYFNIGLATALPNGNLIVPVIEKSNNMDIKELAFKVNDLSERARTNKLLPNEIQNGTFTITNIGTFGNIAGTPIIYQPQVAILAIGAIVKKPAVISTEYGDSIGIKQQIIFSLSFDHRIIDGALGGMFLQQISKNIENFDVNQNL